MNRKVVIFSTCVKKKGKIKDRECLLIYFSKSVDTES